MRLVGGELVSEGTVQVCSDGVWGSVCDSYWDVNDAKVVCTQLGYASEGLLTTQLAMILLKFEITCRFCGIH